MHARFAFSLFAVLGVAFIGGACSDDAPAAGSSTSSSGTSGTTSSGGAATKIPTDQCKSRCGAKAAACGGPASTCDQFCASGVTEDQATCLEGKSCDELTKAILGGTTLEKLCAPSSSSSSSSSSSGSSSSSSSSGGAGLPASIKIKGTLPSGYVPKHVRASGKVVSLFDVAVKPTFDPAPPTGQLPLISDAKDRVTVVSPSAGDCAVVFSFTLNSGEVSVHMEGTDDGAANSCGSFTDKAASDGATLTLKDVPWPNSTTKSTVTIELK